MNGATAVRAPGALAKALAIGIRGQVVTLAARGHQVREAQRTTLDQCRAVGAERVLAVDQPAHREHAPVVEPTTLAGSSQHARVVVARAAA